MLDNPVYNFFFKNSFILLLLIIYVYEKTEKVYICIALFYVVIGLYSL